MIATVCREVADEVRETLKVAWDDVRRAMAEVIDCMKDALAL